MNMFEQMNFWTSCISAFYVTYVHFQVEILL